jgi:hypothetical protein
MPVRVHGVFPIRNVRPQAVSKKLTLRKGRPSVEAICMPVVFTKDLLQEYDVGL